MFFRRVEPLTLLTSTPFGEKAAEILAHISEAGPKKRIPHLSDALRLALVFTYGGETTRGKKLKQLTTTF